MRKNRINLKDYFVLKWQPLTKCNYCCSYCYQTNKTNLNVKNIIINSKFIKEKIENKINNKILLSISGGEISILPIKILLNILEILYSQNIQVLYITTNFSKEANYYNIIYEWCKKHNILFLLECSFHEEFTSEKTFFNKIKKLNFEPCQIQAVVTKNNFSYMNSLKKRYSEIFFEPNIYDDLNDIKFDFTLNEAIRFKIRKLNPYFNKFCYQNEVSIKENGDVYNNNCKQIKYGNINNKLILPNFPFSLKCKKEKCPFCHVQIYENN